MVVFLGGGFYCYMTLTKIVICLQILIKLHEFHENTFRISQGVTCKYTDLEKLIDPFLLF
jgi:hypothetical protein